MPWREKERERDLTRAMFGEAHSSGSGTAPAPLLYSYCRCELRGLPSESRATVAVAWEDAAPAMVEADMPPRAVGKCSSPGAPTLLKRCEYDCERDWVRECE
jgi:hypothetical protein